LADTDFSDDDDLDFDEGFDSDGEDFDSTAGFESAPDFDDESLLPLVAGVADVDADESESLLLGVLFFA